MSYEQKLEKIRALLAHAEGTKFTEEAEAFTAKAQELMARWSVDEAMVAAAAGRVDNTVDRSFITIDANEYRGPKVQVLMAVASNNHVKLVKHGQEYRIVEGKRKRVFDIAMIGTEGDRKTTEILYTSLMLQCQQELLKPEVIAEMQFECHHGAHSIKWRNTFTLGFARKVDSRLAMARRTAESSYRKDNPTTTSESMALVLVGKDKLVDQKTAEIYKRLRSSSRSSAGQGSGAAFGAGQRAGARADLGGKKVGSRSSKGLLA